ncbi:MAG: SHIRT domain-containing protein [Parvimonas sp.]|uniref:SHIRT domain-containing protein n=1 Tax=Parvimonas sp. TaxID=1944660 RepID=UPI002A74F48D|nr:SHIRT domain-containing protein [Parvimonas sp.]MDY3050017.1 SHIRT domain-containing protein [Parvimonas sp.]
MDKAPDGFQFDPKDDRLTFFIFHLTGDGGAFNAKANKDWYIRMSRKRSVYDGQVYAELVDKTTNQVVESLTVNPGERFNFKSIENEKIQNFNYYVKVAKQTFDIDGKETTLYFIGMDSGMGGNTKGTIVYNMSGTDSKQTTNDWSGVLPISPMEQKTKYLKKKDNGLLAEYTQIGGIYGYNYTAAGEAKFENYELVEEPAVKEGNLKKIIPGTYIINDRYDKKRVAIKFNVKEDGTQRIAMLIINPDHDNFKENYENKVLDAKFLDLDRLQSIIMNPNISDENKINEFNKENPNYLLMFISNEIPVGQYNESIGTGTWEYTVTKGTLKNKTQGNKEVKSIVGYLGAYNEHKYAFFTVEEYIFTRDGKEYNIAGLESGMLNKNESINTDAIYYYELKGGVKVFYVNTNGEEIKDPSILIPKADKNTPYNTVDVKENTIKVGDKTYVYKAIDQENLRPKSEPTQSDPRETEKITDEEGTVKTNTVKELTYVYEEVFKVTHEYKSGTPGKELPKEVKDLTPKNQEGKKNGEDVTPTPPQETKVVVKDGEWVFESYDREKGTIENKDEHFIGTWVFKENPQPKTGSVYVKYVTEDGQVLEEESKVKDNAPVGENYTTEKKTFDGYEFVRLDKGSAPANGQVKEEDQYVVYVYKKVEKPVIPNDQNPKNPPSDDDITPRKPNTPNKPDSNLPKTAVMSKSEFYMALVLVSVLGMVIVSTFKREKQK